MLYVMMPMAYWGNIYKAKTYPLMSVSLFKADGSPYDVSSIVDSNFQLDRTAYAAIGPVHLTTFFALSYGLGFATLTATVVHVILFHGR